MKKIAVIIGARPQFIKHAPVQKELSKYFNVTTIHTGQHYDKKMSDIFFNQLEIPQPDFIFDANPKASHAEQIASYSIQIEKILLEGKHDACLVYGDTNSTLAGALVASKLCIPLIHIEAGLRSYNRSMPEEVNRVLTDHVSNILFCPTSTAVSNLLKEGIIENVFEVGDVMFDSLKMVTELIKRPLDGNYYFCTLHRPYNVDNIERLKEIIEHLNVLDLPVVFSIHPRTERILIQNEVDIHKYENIIAIEPLSYVESVSYQSYSSGVITDSGGVQKEAYMLRKKCVTIRPETEWVETLEGNWNSLVFNDLQDIYKSLKKTTSNYRENIYGNGKSAEGIAAILLSILN